MAMCINSEKTEVQHIDKHPKTMAIAINQRILEHTDDFFTYLGGVISNNGSAEQDMEIRIGLACDRMHRQATIRKN